MGFDNKMLHGVRPGRYWGIYDRGHCLSGYLVAWVTADRRRLVEHIRRRDATDIQISRFLAFNSSVLIQ